MIGRYCTGVARVIEEESAVPLAALKGLVVARQRVGRSKLDECQKKTEGHLKMK